MKVTSRRAFPAGAFLGALLLSAAMPAAFAQGGGTGTLKTSIDPGRAGIFIDGKYVGPAANFRIARKYPLPAGEHQVKIVDPRYQEVTKTVSITAGKTTTISEKLTPLPLATPPFGKLRTDGFAKFSAVYINDKFYGHTDEFSNFAQMLLLPPGEYRLKVVTAEGSTALEQPVKIEADKETVVKPK